MLAVRSFVRPLRRPTILGIATVTSLLALSFAAPPHLRGEERGKPGPDPQTLKIFYAGDPGSEREKDFVAFLQKRFKEVGTGDYESFQAGDAKEFDVVIFDWTSIYPRDENGKMNFESGSLESPTAPEVARDFGRPVVMIGAAAGTLSHKLQTAINWKCLCLSNKAHDLATDHPIFQGPLPVELKLEEEEKPFDYWAYPGSKKLGEPIQVWKVQEKTFPEVDPGLVSTRRTFVAAPDAEIISGGINGKGPTSVAIGRHGNFFLWGFSGQPSEMTDAARQVFVNSVCYMKQFEGATPSMSGYVQQGGREAFLERLYSLRQLSDVYLAKQAENYREMIKEHPPSEEQQKQVGDDPAAFFRNLMAPHIEPVRESLPKEVRERFAGDDEALIAYYTENFEYLRPSADAVYVIDEDARSLGISNRSPELLEKCVALLEANEQTELAERVLERYTGKSLDGAEAWRKWLDGEGKSLRFDENEGRFYPAS